MTGYNLLWVVPVLLRIGTAGVLVPYTIKKVAIDGAITKRLTVQFIICAFIAIIVATIADTLSVTTSVILVTIIGFINSLGALAQWKAMQLNLTKTSAFTYGDDLIAMFLAYIILHEGIHLTPTIIIGIIATIGATIMLTYSSSRDKNHATLRLLIWVGIYSLIWGLAAFGGKYFAVKKMPVSAFLLGWYVGSAIGAITIFVLWKSERLRGIHVTKKDLSSGIISAFGIMASLALAYWAYQLAPMLIVQPIFLITRMIFPALIGLWVFNEIKHLKKYEALWFSVAGVGGLCVAIAYTTQSL